MTPPFDIADQDERVFRKRMRRSLQSAALLLATPWILLIMSCVAVDSNSSSGEDWVQEQQKRQNASDVETDVKIPKIKGLSPDDEDENDCLDRDWETGSMA